ncbi:hypothetical protein CUROG_04540 [Corynebacterium urogenitale]|uniref:Uncharacterized protein n=1 Tax=Corynebacterium urogenitale TaxID=2487892 RepID=A0A5J6Z9B4_9CORY|nr:hypothetical protein [Corynebacterium urogenitale]QFQ02283.1 hypothetical protein CUROG_04540 [Corynebacterium urogenitale]
MNPEEMMPLTRAAEELGIAPEELVQEMILSGEITKLEGEILLQVEPELRLRSGEEGLIYNLPGLLWAEVAGGLLRVVVSSTAEGVEEIEVLSRLVEDLGLVCVDTTLSYNPEYFGGIVSVSHYLLV